MLLQDEDNTLIQKALHGSQRAWLKLVRRHEQTVYNYCYRICGQSDEATDLMQEVFVAVFRNLPNFRYQSRFSSWMIRIASNKSIDWLRARHRVPTANAQEVEPQHSISEHGPLGELQKERHNKEVILFMSQLSSDQRLVVELKFFQHLTFEEIAGQLGISSNTAKTRLYAALKNLKGHMEARDAV